MRVVCSYVLLGFNARTSFLFVKMAHGKRLPFDRLLTLTHFDMRIGFSTLHMRLYSAHKCIKPMCAVPICAESTIPNYSDQQYQHHFIAGVIVDIVDKQYQQTRPTIM